MEHHVKISVMPMYVRHTRSVRIEELPARLRRKLAEHAAARQIDLDAVRLWLTRSQNPPASSGLGKLLRRRANRADPDDEHTTIVVLHPTQVAVIIDGANRGTAVLSLPLSQASVAAGSGLAAKFDSGTNDAPGFTISGFPGEQVGSFYVGLGPEPAAQECFSAVRAAISAVKNP